MRELDLTEYTASPEIELTQAELDQLRAHLPAMGIAPRGDNRYDLTPASVVGTFDGPDLSVSVRPKLSIDRVLFLVSYAIGFPGILQSTSGMAQRSSLIEAMIPGYLATVRAALRRGLLQGYRREEDALMTVRGRIRFDDQIRRRHGIVPPIEVRFDEYTEDILPNRLIRAAIDRLGRLRLRSPASRLELRALDQAFGNVALLDYHPRQVPEVAYSRLNIRYRPAVELSRLVLQWVSFDVERGRITVPGLLVDMNEVFEGFVYTALRKALRLDSWAFPRGAARRGLRLDEARRIGLLPDLSWWEEGRCVFVGDVKYKKTVDRAVPNADLYQLLAYSVATDLPGGLLIYAQGEEEPWAHTVVNLGKRLEVVALNLAGSEREVLAQIEDVAKKVRALRASALAEAA